MIEMYEFVPSIKALPSYSLTDGPHTTPKSIEKCCPGSISSSEAGLASLASYTLLDVSMALLYSDICGVNLFC